MSFLLLVVGLMAAAMGLVTIGFGIPINAFSLGNTLIISGTIAVATGLILVALALVLGQLKRIAELLRNKPVRISAAESADAPARQAPQVGVPQAPAPFRELMSEPALAEPPPMPEPRAPEPRFPATASEPPPGPLDWLRAKSKPISASIPVAPLPLAMPEPPVVEIPDEAPLSPRPPQQQQRPMMPPGGEPAVWSPNREAGRDPGPIAPRAEQPMPRATPQVPVEPPKDKERFDLVWPDRGSSPAPAVAEPKVEARAEPPVEAPKPEAKPALEMPMPPIPARPREIRPAAERRMPEPARRPAERGPAILKSGVIDGMPYTLYADGSIEAQLPQGMVKFASVDALRAHLEKQS